jgi:hypothetical protein
MTKLALILVIACGIVLGQLGLEVLGLLFKLAGRVYGWFGAIAAKKMLATRQAQYEAQQVALTRQRPPLVTETGGRISENHDTTS